MRSRTLSYCYLLALMVLVGCSKPTSEELHNERLAAAKHAQLLADELRVATSSSIRPSIFIMYPAKPIPDDPEQHFNQENYLKEMDTDGSIATAFSLGKKGLVVTAAHAVEGELCKIVPVVDLITQKKTKETYCVLTTQTREKAFLSKLLLFDKVHDIAVLQIKDTRDVPPFLEPAATGSFGEGTSVITIGSPLGYNNFTITGYINTINFIDMEEGWGYKQRHIQFIAPLQPGNSGGPLVSLTTGKVVGLITWVRGVNVFGAIVLGGLCQATPIETVMEVLKPYLN